MSRPTVEKLHAQKRAAAAERKAKEAAGPTPLELQAAADFDLARSQLLELIKSKRTSPRDRTQAIAELRRVNLAALEAETLRKGPSHEHDHAAASWVVDRLKKWADAAQEERAAKDRELERLRAEAAARSAPPPPAPRPPRAPRPARPSSTPAVAPVVASADPVAAPVSPLAARLAAATRGAR